MADFCKLCSEDNFGEDFGDMANITKPEDTANGRYATVLCEGCGDCQVDHTGTCISPDCLERHGGTK